MDNNKKTITGGRITLGLLTALLALAFGPNLLAQSFNAGGTGPLGDFLNPVTVSDGTNTCNYATLVIDLSLGKVFATPGNFVGGTGCNPAPVDVTSAVFTPPIASFDGSAGVLDVASFRLRQSNVGGTSTPARNVTLSFVANANNTPVVIRAGCPATPTAGCGNVTIDASQIVSLDGGAAGEVGGTGGLLRGPGGAGGPGGYRGGDGGNGGITPSVGSSGFGPGGAAGGAIATGAGPARFLTTGVVLPSLFNNTISVSNLGGGDLLTQLRGGSGGGGGGGTTNSSAGRGGGGGGGAILIAANSAITVNGTLSARGGLAELGACPPAQRYGSPGTGGAIRLVSATITGAGAITATAGQQGNPGCAGGSSGSDNGLVRLEAFTISFSGTLSGGVAAASAPGQILMPNAAPAGSNPFLRFGRMRDAGNASNCVSSSASDSPCALFPAASQATPGRTGSVSAVDATMPNPASVSSTVNIDFIVGPIPGFPASPTNQNITLVVTSLDPAQGAAKNYIAAISPLQTDSVFCPASACKVTMTGVTLPLGFSSMSAFVVLNLTSGGTLARNFPTMYEGEPIESVKLQSSGKDTEYVLISKSGREFPYVPGTKR